MKKTRFVSEGPSDQMPVPVRLACTLCVSFTVVMVATMAAGSAFAPPESQAGIGLCWSIFGACAVMTLLQAAFFTDLVFKRAGYVARVGMFGGCMYVVLAAVAMAARWFPTDNLGAWALFTAIYLLALGVTAALFRAVERSRSRRFDELLKRYRSEREG